MKILVAYDGSPASRGALEEVVRRPWPEGTRVRLVTIVEKPRSVPPPSGFEVFTPLFERVCSSLREEAHRKLNAALAMFESRPELYVGFELREGNPKESLMQAIEEWEPDLVFVGLDGREGGMCFPGSVCYHIVMHASCSVEIVRRASEKASTPELADERVARAPV